MPGKYNSSTLSGDFHFPGKKKFSRCRSIGINCLGKINVQVK